MVGEHFVPLRVTVPPDQIDWLDAVVEEDGLATRSAAVVAIFRAEAKRRSRRSK
jgi:hypothetical protein